MIISYVVTGIILAVALACLVYFVRRIYRHSKRICADGTLFDIALMHLVHSNRVLGKIAEKTGEEKCDVDAFSDAFGAYAKIIAYDTLNEVMAAVRSTVPSVSVNGTMTPAYGAIPDSTADIKARCANIDEDDVELCLAAAGLRALPCYDTNYTLDMNCTNLIKAAAEEYRRVTKRDVMTDEKRDVAGEDDELLLPAVYRAVLFSGDSTQAKRSLRCVTVSGQGSTACDEQTVRSQVVNLFSWFGPACIYVEVLFGTSVRISIFNSQNLEKN